MKYLLSMTYSDEASGLQTCPSKKVSNLAEVKLALWVLPDFIPFSIR